MDISSLYTTLLVQPVYNLVVAVYATLGQESTGVTLALFGLVGAALYIPTMIRNYHEQQKVRSLQTEITAIQQQGLSDEQTQQQILSFLKSHGVRFQGESLYLFGQAIVLLLLYPILTNHWTIDPSLLYSFTPSPDQLSSTIGNLTVTHSSPTMSMLPAILLFFDLKLSYKEQNFLTGFIDRWYPIILPLFTYFLIFWLPSGLSIVLAVSLAVSLYLKIILQLFTRLRQPRRS